MTNLFKRVGDKLRNLNEVLRRNQTELETRIAERTRELEESQAQVLHQEKMAAFGLLAAGIAHEVGNPLASISGIVQMLDRHNPDSYTRDKLGLVTGQLARIQAILRELISFSRPADTTHGLVSARDVVEEALAIAKFYKGGKNRRIESRVSDDLPPLLGVRDQFVQVVFNLVLNSIDATGKGGRITVEVFPGLDVITFSVSDDGSGIAPEHRDRLFRPYFTTKKQGTGLGLFVIRRIVEEHKGRIEVDSLPGLGATFRVVFPIEHACTLPAANGKPTEVTV